MYSGSAPYTLQRTLLKRMSGSTTSGWKVIVKWVSSFGGRKPLEGVIVKKRAQKVVSHSNLAPMSPRLLNYRVFVFLELTVTTPKPIVSSISFSSMPWQVPYTERSLRVSWFSTIL
jgi:hypothetical protein